MFLFNCCTLVLVIYCSRFSTCFAVFDRNRTMVWFQPYLNYGHFDHIGSMDVFEVVKMLEVISTKFNSIFMEHLYLRELDQSVALIPNAVAHYNQMNGNKTSSVPLQLYMHFMYSKPLQDGTRLLFDIVKSLADNANKIYPQTVKTLMFWYNKENCKDLEAMITYALASIKPLESYSLGITMDVDEATEMSKCLKNANLNSPLTLLKFFMFRKIHRKSETKAPNELLPELFNSYGAAKAEILKYRQKLGNIQFALNTGYRSNDNYLVEFWKSLNEWSIRTNNLVVFYQAFDQRTRAGVDENGGWWRIVQSDKYFNASDYKYEEKEEVLAREKLALTESESSSSIFAVILCACVLVVLLFTIFSWICFYARVMKMFPGHGLSHAERIEFFEGKKDPEEVMDENGHLNIMNHLGYDRSLEVSLKTLKIHEDQVLGNGNFGVVCVATIIWKGQDIKVAMKMAKSGCSLPALKGLLSEIKVLSYLGEHENITTLMGAYTMEIEKGKVYVFTELCEKGSLERYLQSVDDSVIFEMRSQCNHFVQDSISTDGAKLYGHLYKWACEISQGMEFLAMKSVVHADLATRNVLLTSKMQAKICDFGLSRRLYNLANYEKKENAQIPWRWTAPEALRGLVFNEKTDVWSFGVTLWEMFTLGDLPYVHIWGSDTLLEYLESEQKLPKPLTCSYTNIYEEVMQKCWTLEPKRRPTFSQLSISLRNFFTSYNPTCSKTV